MSPFPTDPDVTNFRVDWGLPMLQAEVCILCCHLVCRVEIRRAQH